MTLASTLRSLHGRRLRDEDGKEHVLELLPPADEGDLARLTAGLPGRLPDDVREALLVSKGLAGGPLESFSLLDLEGFGLDEVFPHAYSIAHDGFGNFWVLDLLPDTVSWGPVFYACHDPPVIAWQAETIERFLLDVVGMWEPGTRKPRASRCTTRPSIASGVRKEICARLATRSRRRIRSSPSSPRRCPRRR